jgi:hypothetical protein
LAQINVLLVAAAFNLRKWMRLIFFLFLLASIDLENHTRTQRAARVSVAQNPFFTID